MHVGNSMSFAVGARDGDAMDSRHVLRAADCLLDRADQTWYNTRHNHFGYDMSYWERKNW